MRSLVVAITAIWAAAWGAFAAPPPAPPAEAYGALPSIDFMQLSPSGQRLAYVEVTGDTRRIMVLDLAGKTLFAAGLGQLKVRDIDWAGDDYVLVTTSATLKNVDVQNGEFAQVGAINMATRKVIWVMANQSTLFDAVFGYYGANPESGRWYGYFGGVTLTRPRGSAPALNPGGNFPDLYRVDLETGRPQLARSPKAISQRWVVDGGTVIAHSEFIDVTGQWRLYDERTGDLLVSLKAPTEQVALVGAGRRSGTILVHQNGETEEWDLATRAHTPLPVTGEIDRYVRDPTTGYLVGVTITAEGRSEAQLFDPALRSRLAGLKKGLGPSATLVSWSRDHQTLIAKTATERDPGTYWLVTGNAAKPVAFAYPKVPDASVGSVKMIDYKAADGLAMQGVLTLPPGRDAKSLPLVVMPHGGPATHDTLTFDWWAQAFAARGYAVFQPNFRGSDGYGTSFHDAGYGQWGRKMQTDISDGVAELARQGVVDPKRACIVGGSYGGYAALAGVTVQQGLYRCAVAYAGVADPNQMLQWVARSNGGVRNPATRYWRQFMGATSDSDRALNEVSPLRLASRADAPVLLIHGLDDTVVPSDQTRVMHRALKAAGKPVEQVILKGEDHWLSTGATRTEMLKATLVFVEKHNPAD